MLLGLALGGSILILIVEMLGFPSAVRKPIDLRKFTYGRQRLVLCVIDILFILSILITYLLQPTAELLIIILFFVQIIVGFIYTEVLSFLCKKKYLCNVADEIIKLNLDLDQDIIELRRNLMENSEISCSVLELKKAIELISKNTNT